MPTRLDSMMHSIPAPAPTPHLANDRSAGVISGQDGTPIKAGKDAVKLHPFVFREPQLFGSGLTNSRVRGTRAEQDE